MRDDEMYNKIKETIIRNKYFKIYQSDSYNPIDILQKLLNNNFKIFDVIVYEDADLGFKTFDGSYSVEEFLEKYDTFRKEDILKIMINLEDGNRIVVDDNSISLITTENIEIDSYLSMNTPKL